MNRVKLKFHELDNQLLFVFGGLVILCLFFGVTTNSFFSGRNLMNILLQTSIAVIIAIGETYVIASGAIDLSVGSTAAFSGMITAILIKNAGISPAWAVLGGILSGVACGLLNSFVVNILGVVPFIATLGTNSIIRGIILVVLDGVPISGMSSSFTWIGSGRLDGWLPYPVLFMVIICAIMWFILKRSHLGRNIYAIGSNEQAAFLSGINIKKVKLKMYIISSLMCAIAGIILTARLNSGAPTAFEGDETDAIAAAVIGGASLAGGKGSIAGTIVGAFIIGVLSNGLNLIGLNYFWQQVAIGVVIIMAVYLDVIRGKFSK